MEAPECPVCLQPFDGESTIPRVLACGHSTCHSCLIQLPKPPFPRTIRCPACTQLVAYTHPSALPKNIDLLRISSSLLPSNPNPNPKTPSSPFIPDLWSRQFHCKWKNWVVPQHTVSIQATVDVFLYGNFIDSQVPSRCSTKIHQNASLFKVGSFLHNDDSRFSYSYLAKAMWVLFKMSDGASAELELILTSSIKGYRICTAYGLWYNDEDQSLYLVWERKHTTLLNATVPDIKDDMSSFAMIGMELCEALIHLHQAELVTGCTSLSCFAINDFGHVFIDLNQVLIVGFELQKIIKETISFAQNNGGKTSDLNLNNNLSATHAFPSPEILVEFIQKEGINLKLVKSTYAVSYSSDIWSVACILMSFLAGKSFIEETHSFISNYILSLINENVEDCEGLYMGWFDKVCSLLDTRLNSEYILIKELLYKCLCLDPRDRPIAVDIWKCMRGLIIKPKFEVMRSSIEKLTDGSRCHCLLLGDLLWPLKKTNKVDENVNDNDLKDEKFVVEDDVIEGICEKSLKCVDLKGHLDCVSGLAIGGGYLFSSSFDKTVKVWSLQGLNHVHTFKRHEHKIMAVVFVNKEPPLCISADNGGEIFIWAVQTPFEEKPIRRLNEEKDWRYSGIHALAVSESPSEYFYTGSGDKSIKAWSMHDYTLSSTMSGHKSVVSTLVICSEVLYSGSWDGSIRLWCLSDHTPLAVLGEEEALNGISARGSVLSLAAHSQTLVAAHENGSIKIWNKDIPLESISAHTSSIFSICVEGQWLFSGGWDKTVVVQKISGDESEVDVTQVGSIAGDSVITALFYCQGKLFVGQADRIIKVYSFGG